MHDAHYAVVVGINRYPALGDLRGPVGDAALFAEWLRDPAGGALPPDNIRVVPASGTEVLHAYDAKPAVAEIVRALGDLNRTVEARVAADPTVWKRTRLYLFVAGHGMLPDGSDGALFAANVSLDELGHCLDLRRYAQWYRRSGRFRELVLFADCCRNRIDGAAAFGPPFTEPGEIENVVRIVVGYGAEFGREAFEGPVADQPDQRRGYFTEALLSGLRRPRPDPTWGALRRYIADTVPQLAAAHGHDQRAELNGDDDVVFGPGTSDDIARRVTITFASGTPGPVDLLGGRLEVLGTWNPADGPWVRQLRAGLYAVVSHGSATQLAGITVAGADLDVHV
ncbi:caspase family protein [Dactylosporangium sp. NPDC005572]|uniref:caspase family protein n=1 Tax=Dactylosporangium sp. NPDC005572 TaxID=3156889 RepID=UPI0033BE7A33